MSTTEPSSTLRIDRRVSPAVALAFLRGSRYENVFLLSRVIAAGTRPSHDPSHGMFLGAFDEDASLRGLAFVGNTGTLALSVDDADVAAAFARPLATDGLRFTIVVSEFAAGRAFLGAYRAAGGPEPQLNRKQLFYVLRAEDVARGIPDLDVEQASIDSIDDLSELSCLMVAEDLKLDRTAIDNRRYRVRIATSVTQGRSFLAREPDGERVIFKCDLAVTGSEGALLEGVYTVKDQRRKHVATRAVHALCRALLQDDRIPFVALHVDARNIGARKVYEAVGFKHVMDFRLMLMPLQPET